MFRGQALIIICLVIPTVIMAQDLSNLIPRIPNPFAPSSAGMGGSSSENGGGTRFGILPLAGEVHTRFCNDFCANSVVQKLFLPQSFLCANVYRCPPASSGATPSAPATAGSSSSTENISRSPLPAIFNINGPSRPANGNSAGGSSTSRSVGLFGNAL